MIFTLKKRTAKLHKKTSSVKDGFHFFSFGAKKVDFIFYNIDIKAFTISTLVDILWECGSYPLLLLRYGEKTDGKNGPKMGFV